MSVVYVLTYTHPLGEAGLHRLYSNSSPALTPEHALHLTRVHGPRAIAPLQSLPVNATLLWAVDGNWPTAVYYPHPVSNDRPLGWGPAHWRQQVQQWGCPTRPRPAQMHPHPVPPPLRVTICRSPRRPSRRSGRLDAPSFARDREGAIPDEFLPGHDLPL
jgi:hypothetical protein